MGPGQPESRPLKTKPMAWAAAFILLILNACAVGPPLSETHGELPEASEGMGRIYFYRTDIPLLTALEPAVIVNSKLVGHSQHATVFYRDAMPGRYEVFLESDTENVLKFTIASGQVQFIKTFIDLEITGTELAIELVEEELGRQEVHSLTLLEPVETEEIEEKPPLDGRTPDWG